MTILACLALAVLLYSMMHFGQRVLVEWMSDRVVKRILARPADAPRARLDPESRFVINITESEVSCHRPDGIVETVRWDELEKINILTNSDGPFAPDCFWLLIGPGTTGCCIPQGATGDVELLARKQELPGFNNQGFMEAISSHQEATTNSSWYVRASPLAASAVARSSSHEARGPLVLDKLFPIMLLTCSTELFLIKC